MDYSALNFLWSNLYLLVLWLSFAFFIRKKQNPAAGRSIILGGLVLSLLLPTVSLKSALFASTLPAIQIDFLSEFSSQAAIEKGNTGFDLILWLYLLGAAVTSAYFITSLLKLKKELRVKIWRDGYFELPNSKAAFSFGRKIYLGAEIPMESRKYILEHERNHVRHAHFLDLFLLQVLRIAFWFNPAIYKLHNYLQEVHEYQADEIAPEAKTAYLNTLLQHQFKAYNNTFIHSFNSHHLKLRIMRIQNKEIKSLKLRHLSIPLLLFAFLFLSRQAAFSAEGNAVQSELSSLEEDQKPEFPGGIVALSKFVSTHLRYPESAKKEGLEGTVFVKLKIDEAGNCIAQTVLNGINSEMDQAALASVQNMPQWIPAESAGKKVSSELTLPIKFVLGQDKK